MVGRVIGKNKPNLPFAMTRVFIRRQSKSQMEYVIFRLLLLKSGELGTLGGAIGPNFFHGTGCRSRPFKGQPSAGRGAVTNDE